jgi:DNA-binding MarR family transcriptional regulator
VKLTEKGRQLVNRILENHQTQLDKLLAGLDPAEQQELHRMMKKMGAHLEQQVNEIGG